jgi:deoxyhypusine synthase
MSRNQITEFLERHFLHFNAAALIEGAHAYRRHLDKGGYMLLTLAGAMSTAELGISLAEMIRQKKVTRSVAPARI